MTINYAHRGASGDYPENTMLAFQMAVEMGCTGIETDVQMTKDGVLVLIHDEMVNRTTDGVGFVKDYTYSELRKFDAGSWMSEEFAGLRIPTLEELITYTLDKRIVLDLELKTGIVQYPGIEQLVINMVHRFNIQGRVILSSFNHYSMVKCKEISKDVRTGLLYMEGLYKPEVYAKSACADALHPNYYAVNGEIVKAAHDEALMVNVFTVNEINYMKYFADLRVDGIITNYPDKLKKILEG